jgi:hypothetical protein
VPLWTFVEVATAAARARRAFGPKSACASSGSRLRACLFALRLLRTLDAGSIGSSPRDPLLSGPDAPRSA